MFPMKPIALITGASSGIGAASARLFASQQYHLILAARRQERLDALKADLEQEYGIECFLLKLDVRDKNSVKDQIANLPEEWRKIAVLINNAGLASGLSAFYEGDTEDWDAMIDTNVKGLLYVSRAVAPLMIASGSGHIINIGSVAGKEVYDKGNVYCATKHAVDALNKAMRLELSPHNIRVTGIHPGAVETEFSVVRFHGDRERASRIYEGFENLVAEDIADAVFWVVSRPAHVNINDMIIMPTAQPIASVIHRKS